MTHRQRKPTTSVVGPSDNERGVSPLVGILLLLILTILLAAITVVLLGAW